MPAAQKEPRRPRHHPPSVLNTPLLPQNGTAPVSCSTSPSSSASSSTPPPKYKTELCRNYSLKGYCPYRNKCQFAHGPSQLSQQLCLGTNKKFRTKKCRSFWEEGYCRYGVRCQFEHRQELKYETVSYLKIWKLVLEEEKEGEKSRVLSGNQGEETGRKWSE